MICPICGSELAGTAIESFLRRETISIKFDSIKEIVLWFLSKNNSIQAAKFIKEIYGCGLGDAVRIRNMIKVKYL